MKRMLTAVLAVLVSSACSDDDRATLEALAGTYEVIAANDSPVPGPVFEIGVCQFHGEEGELTLTADGLFSGSGSGEQRCGTEPNVLTAPYSIIVEGFYELDGQQLTFFLLQPVSGQVTGTVSGTTFLVEGTDRDGHEHSVLFAR